MLRTKRSRLTFVVFILASITGAAGGWVTVPALSFYWKVYVPATKGMGLDERSPTGRVNVTWMLTPEDGPPCYKSASGYLQIYRNAIFCDTVGLEKTELGDRLIYFQRLVDAEYAEHYQEIAARIVTGIILAWLMTALLLGASRVAKWVQRGEPS